MAMRRYDELRRGILGGHRKLPTERVKEKPIASTRQNQSRGPQGRLDQGQGEDTYNPGMRGLLVNESLEAWWDWEAGRRE
jgi:hypothetical protein